MATDSALVKALVERVHDVYGAELSDVERKCWTCKLWIAERIPSSRALTTRDEATVATGPTILLFFPPPVLLIDPFFSG